MYQMSVNEWVKEWKKRVLCKNEMNLSKNKSHLRKRSNGNGKVWFSCNNFCVWNATITLEETPLVVRLALYALNRNTLIFSSSAQTFSLRNYLNWMSNQVIMKTVVSVFVSVAYSVIFMICSMFFSVFIQIETLTFQNYQLLHFFGQPSKYTYNTINLI